MTPDRDPLLVRLFLTTALICGTLAVVSGTVMVLIFFALLFQHMVNFP